jgi:hypothetical protein
MILHRAIFVLFVSLFPVCSAFAAAEPAGVMQIHWLGLKQISTDTNAAQFMKIWQLPETRALVDQTLAKLSRWPGHRATNETSARLRPLLEDLISSECYLEIPFLSASGKAGRREVVRGPSAPSNSQLSTLNHQLFLAVRLPADRARIWQTNLAALGRLGQITYSRRGDWTLVGFKLAKNIAQTEFADRITHRHTPAAKTPWLDADVDSSFLTALFSSLSAHRMGGEGRSEAGLLSTLNFQPPTFNQVHLTVTGEKGVVHTHATLDLSRAFTAPLPPWEVPTNLIHGPLTSFTAMRGFSVWLAMQPVWKKLQFSAPPDQAFVWSQNGIPFQTYFTVPLPDATNQLAALAGRLVQNANPWLATNAQGSFAWQAGLPGLVWNDALIISPVVKPETFHGHDYLLGGLYPLSRTDAGLLPIAWQNGIRSRTNLVYFQDEMTGQRVGDDFFILQLFRVVFQKSQLPDKALATRWLKSAAPLLGNCTTEVIQTGPQQLTFTRNSTIGLTALELHLLADWLESPQFPRGLHTFLAPPDAN